MGSLLTRRQLCHRVRRRSRVADGSSTARRHSGSPIPKLPGRLCRPPRRCTPLAAPTPSADHSSCHTAAQVAAATSFDDKFDAMADDWDDKKEVEEEMHQGGAAGACVALVWAWGRVVWGDTVVGEAEQGLSGSVEVTVSAAQ